MPETFKTYQLGQPWIIYSYPRSDEEADRLGGVGLVVMTCAICGETEDCALDLAHEPPPETLAPDYQHPQRIAFRAAHLHPLQQTAPESWSLPLLNPDALADGDMLDILTDVVEKARQ